MAGSRFLSENFFDTTYFTGHTVTAESDVTGHEPFRVGNARRHTTDYWTSDTDNQDSWIRVEMDQARDFDMLAIDRGHNLEGETVQLQGSNDGVGWTTILNFTVPSSVASGGDLRNSPGIKTEEGVYLRQFTTETYSWARLYVPAMGAGLRPQVVGLYVGLSWAPEYPPIMPYAPLSQELRYQVTESDRAWMGSSQAAHRRSVEIALQLGSESEYDDARIHIENRTFRGKVTWFVPDQEKSERAWLGKAPPGQYEFVRNRDWSYWQTRFPLVEESPLQGVTA